MMDEWSGGASMEDSLGDRVRGGGDWNRLEREIMWVGGRSGRMEAASAG